MREQGKIWAGMDIGVVEDIVVGDRQLMLDGEPVTAIVIEVRSTAGSKQLALEFAYRFAEHWPCVCWTRRTGFTRLRSYLPCICPVTMS